MKSFNPDDVSDVIVSADIGTAADGFVSDNLISWFTAINYDMMKPLKWQIPLLKILNYAIKGNVSRIMVSAPPQHGKTELIVNAFVSWYMVNNPFDKVILTAYSQQRATKYGEKIRDIINHFSSKTRFKPQLKQDNKSKKNFMFNSPYTAELLASGGHGAIMGNPANLVVIDDPIKELSDARSPTMQDNLKNWYLGSIDTRLRKRDDNKPPILIVVAQRLHQRDLQGLILNDIKEPFIDGKEALNRLDNGLNINPDTWVYMNFPALSIGADEDILNRPKNTPLWSNHKDYDDLIIDRKRKGTYRFEMIMQGNPTREEDYIFRHEWFYNSPDYDDNCLTCIVSIDDVPDDSYLYPRGRFWDLAASSSAPSKSNDFYCGSLISKSTKDDTLYIYDIKRSKKQALQVLNVIKDTIVSDGFDVTTVIEQEAGSQSVLFLNDLQSNFSNYNIETVKPTEAKLYRSYELKRLAENRSIKFVVKPDDYNYNWIHTAIRELELFDGSDSNANRHDDIVDSLSTGANYFKMNNHILGGFIYL